MASWRCRPLSPDDDAALDALWRASPLWLPQDPGFGRALAGGESTRLVRLGLFHEERLRGAVTFWPVRQRGSTRWLSLPFTPFGGVLASSADCELVTRDAERLWGAMFFTLATRRGGPVAARAELTLAPGCVDARELAAAGWQLRPHYNYLTRWSADGEAWARAESNVRRQARKAQAEGIVVRGDAPEAPEHLRQLWALNASHQGLDPALGEPLVRLARWLVGEKRGFVLTAVDAESRPHAAALIGHDAHRCYYLAGASDPMRRGSGAPTLVQQVAFSTIEQAGLPRCYDWVGANTRSIAHFKTKFRPDLEVLVAASHETPWLSFVRAGARLLGSLKKGNAASAPEGDD